MECRFAHSLTEEGSEVALCATSSSEKLPLLNFRRRRGRCRGWAKRRSPGLVNFVPSVAYHFCLNLPWNFSQPGAHFLAQPHAHTSSLPLAAYRIHRASHVCAVCSSSSSARVTALVELQREEKRENRMRKKCSLIFLRCSSVDLLRTNKARPHS